MRSLLKEVQIWRCVTDQALNYGVEETAKTARDKKANLKSGALE